MSNAMKRTVQFFMPLSKIDQNDDGTLTVSGIASSEAIDADGETILAEAIKGALPDFFAYGTGALREMHQSVAAGTVDDAQVDDGVTYITTTVVDPIAIKKVLTKTYKGFSVGGKVMERSPADRKVITKLKLVEVSLVDRPANPEAVIQMFKAETPEETEVSKPELSEADTQAVSEIATMLNKGAISASTLLKAAQDALSPPAAAERVKLTGESLQKGISGVAQFACLLQEVSWMASDSAWEAEMEGDASPVPAQLRDWLSAGIAIFAAMSAEETAEMMAALKPAPAVEAQVIASAEPASDLAKAGAKFSTTTKAMLADIHKAMQECCAKLDGLGYKDAEEDGGDDMAAAASAPDVKAEALTEPTSDDALTKALAERDALIASMAARLEKLEAQPLPGKALLKAMAVDKQSDVGSAHDFGKAAVDELPANATPHQRAHHELVKIFKSGGVPLAAR